VRPRTPLRQRNENEQEAEDELEDIDRGGWLALLVGIGGAGDEQDDRADNNESDEPADDERARSERARA
jgi:hypothetical protein